MLVLVHAYANLNSWFSALQVLYLHLPCRLDRRGTIFEMWATPENCKPIAPTPSNVNSLFFMKMVTEKEFLEVFQDDDQGLCCQYN